MSGYLTQLFILFEVVVLLLAQPGGQIQHCCQNDLCPADCRRCDGTPTCYDLSDELGCSNDADNKLLSYRKPPVFVPFVMNILKSGLRREKMELYRKNPNHACFSTSRETTTEMPLWEQLLRKLQRRPVENVPATVRPTTMTSSTAMPVWKLLLYKLRGQTTTVHSLVTSTSAVTTITPTPSTHKETSAINRNVDNERIISSTTTDTSLTTNVATKLTTQLDTSKIPMSGLTTSVTAIPTSSLDLNETSQTSQSTRIESSSIITLQTTQSDQQSTNELLNTTVDTEKSTAAPVTHSAIEEPVSYQSTTSLPPTTSKHARMGIAVSISSDFSTNEDNITQTIANTTSFSQVTTSISNVMNATNETITNLNSTTGQTESFQTVTESLLLNSTLMNSNIKQTENNTDYGESPSSTNESAVITLRPLELNKNKSRNISVEVNLTSETDESQISRQNDRTSSISSFPANAQTEDLAIGNITYNNITHYPSKNNTSTLALDARDNDGTKETMNHKVNNITFYNITTEGNNTPVQKGNDTQNTESLSLNVTNDKNSSSISEYSLHKAVFEGNRTENRNSYNTSNNDDSVTVSIVSNDGNVEVRDNMLKNKVASEPSYMSPDNEIRIILEKLHALAEMEEKNISLRPKLSEFNVKYKNDLEKGQSVNSIHQPLSPSPTITKTKTNTVDQQTTTDTPTTSSGKANGSSPPKTTATEVINVIRKDLTAPPPAPWPRNTFFDFNLNELFGFTSVSPLDLGFYRSSPNPLSWDAFFGDIGGVPVAHNNEFSSTGTKDHSSNVKDPNVNKNLFSTSTTTTLSKEKNHHDLSTTSSKIVEYKDPTIRTGSVKSTTPATARNHQTTTERHWTLTTNSLVTPKPSTQSSIPASETSRSPFKPLKPSPLPQSHSTHHVNTSNEPPNPSTHQLKPSTQPQNLSTQPPISTNQPPIPSTRLPRPSALPSKPISQPTTPSFPPPRSSTQQPSRNYNAESDKKGQVQSTTYQPMNPERRNDVSVAETNAILPVESISSWWEKVYSTSPPAIITSPLNPTTHLPYTAQEQCYEIQDVSGFCQTRSGHYNNPSDCRTFYVCMWGYLHRCSCPPNTMFDSKIQVCNWDNLVTCVK